MCDLPPPTSCLWGLHWRTCSKDWLYVSLSLLDESPQRIEQCRLLPLSYASIPIHMSIIFIVLPIQWQDMAGSMEYGREIRPFIKSSFIQQTVKCYACNHGDQMYPHSLNYDVLFDYYITVVPWPLGYSRSLSMPISDIGSWILKVIARGV